MTSDLGGGSNEQRVALVTGLTGITGRHCVEVLLKHKQEGTRVDTLARRDMSLSGREAMSVHQVQ